MEPLLAWKQHTVQDDSRHQAGSSSFDIQCLRIDEGEQN